MAVEKTKCRMKWCYYPGRQENGECDKYCMYNTQEIKPHWIYNPKQLLPIMYWLVWECSECGESQERTTPFCPMCGAKMEKVDKNALRSTSKSE